MANLLNIFDKSSFIRKASFDFSNIEDVANIVDDVAKRHEKALFEYVAKFEGIDVDSDCSKYSLWVGKDEIAKHGSFSNKELEKDILFAKENIERFHKTEIEHSKIVAEPDFLLGQKIVPLDSVGCYVPGGKAFYPSSLMMTVLPAKIAGVKNIIVITPPQKDGTIRKELLEISCLLGVDAIIAAGGAHAIAYAAYGSENQEFFSGVNKIVGPGNSWVTLAKKLVYGVCDIDMLAGPSEILVVADKTANPRYIARDLLSQAEHGEDSIAALIATEQSIIDEVNRHLEDITKDVPRKDIILASLKGHSKATVVADVYEALSLANDYAAEHLEVVVDLSDSEIIGRINAAGSLFIGSYTSEPLGDYIIGSNHVLPTFGAAKFSNPLGVYDFYRRVNIISAGKNYVKKHGGAAVRLAEYEGLYAHANAISERLNDI